MSEPVNVVALVKGDERYVFMYEDHQASAILRTFGRYASDPALSLNWYDAAVLSQKVREQRPRPRPDRFTLPQFDG